VSGMWIGTLQNLRQFMLLLPFNIEPKPKIKKYCNNYKLLIRFSTVSDGINKLFSGRGWTIPSDGCWWLPLKPSKFWRDNAR